MALFFYSVAVVGVLFAMFWAQRAWGMWASLAIALIGGVFVRFVPFPFGTLLAAAGAVPIIYAARVAIWRRQGGPPPGDAVPGSSVDIDDSPGPRKGGRT